MKDRPSLFINGKWKSGSGDLFKSQNPIKNEIIWEGNAASQEDVNEAIISARSAFKEWTNLSIDKRSSYLYQYGEVLKLNLVPLALIISRENGKPLWEAKQEVTSMIDKIRLSIESYGRRCPGIIQDHLNNRSITRHHPHGVVGIMGPYNFPGHLPNGHIIPAILAGNTVVFKPSELTPSVAEEMIKYWEKAQLPKGVINLIQGGPKTGQSLLNHPDVNGIFFTGSYNTGKYIAELLGPQPEKIIALEMGGNNPLIVSKISDTNIAAYFTIQSAFISSGQRCTCARRLILLQNNDGKKFIESLVKAMSSIVIGHYDDVPEPYMGPLISEAHALKVLAAQKNLVKLGGKSIVEMKQLLPHKSLLSPGLMDVTAIKNLPDEEIFGPFLQLIWVKDFEEALVVANQTKFGLSAALFSEDQNEYDQFYQNIRAGIVNWNTPTTGALSSAPFGGVKSSGNHRPSAYYAADYCSYPIASLESNYMKAPLILPPGIKVGENIK
ncbi:MAG: succinylglutamate-semialdehyde dehydrogenase [Parachlamydiaceae bacterium]|nr:succinylglutamate-semialdehyde dehydrogenase [Parachlamydiaceae bacterium]